MERLVIGKVAASSCLNYLLSELKIVNHHKIKKQEYQTRSQINYLCSDFIKYYKE